MSTGRSINSGTTTHISLASDGTGATGASFGAAISADERYVAFSSNADNLVAGDTNFSADIFLPPLDVRRRPVHPICCGGDYELSAL